MWTLDNQPPDNIRTKQQHAEIEVETWRGGESQPHYFIMLTMGNRKLGEQGTSLASLWAF